MGPVSLKKRMFDIGKNSNKTKNKTKLENNAEQLDM